MTLYLDDGDVRLHHGDALETLRQLPTGSVDMIATSPPFYGLRDYGTGQWEGGNEGCDHIQGKARQDAAEGRHTSSTFHGSMSTEHGGGDIQFRNLCGLCGARRVDRQIGLEETPDQWVASLVAVFRECRRVLADHGTLWVEIGDSYGGGNTNTSEWINEANGKRNIKTKNHPRPALGGHKPKDLLGQPWLLAFALRADGWYLRSEIIWARPNPMPESVTDRPTKSHSTVFLLSKKPKYFYDADAIREPHVGPPVEHFGRVVGKNGRRGDASGITQHFGSGKPREYNPLGANARSVWTIPTQPTPFAHFATWPQKLVARMIQAGTSEHGKCPECGKPWVRDVIERDEYTEWKKQQGWTKRTTGGGTSARQQYGRVTPGTGTNAATVPAKTQTLGWSPSCHHDQQPVPCTVLDPFAGSGTTLLVARHHGRHAIGIELNADYCQIAATQLQQLSLLTQPVEQPEPTRVSHGGRGTGLTGGAYNPPGQSPHSNARPSK